MLIKKHDFWRKYLYAKYMFKLFSFVSIQLLNLNSNSRKTDNQPFGDLFIFYLVNFNGIRQTFSEKTVWETQRRRLYKKQH